MLRFPKLESQANLPLKNLTYLFVKCLCTVVFALFLWALSLRNTYKDMRKQRDEAQEASRKGAYKRSDLHNKLRDTENQLYYANERLQDAENGMEEERTELRNTIHGLNEQHLIEEEEIRSLTQHVSNTECDCEEYGRRLNYASRDNEKLAQEIRKLQRENQQLEASSAKLNETIDSLRANGNNMIPGPVAAAQPPSPIYTQSLTAGDTPPEQTTADEDLEEQVAAKDGELAKRDGRIRDLEHQNGTLNSDIIQLRTDLGTLEDEHKGCSGRLSTRLSEKDDEIRDLQAEKTRAEKESAETIASLRIKLTEKETEVTALVAESSTSAETVQRLQGVSHELDVARSAHAQCEANSSSQGSRIGQLEQMLHVKANEIERLQRQVQPSLDELAELKERHAQCGEHANTHALEVTQLRNAQKVLQETNADLSQQLATARNKHASLIQEGQLLENQTQTLKDLQICTQTEVRSLQGQIEGLKQTVDRQQQHIQTLETNCPTCQKLREALDAVAKDIEMSDDDTRAQMRREVAAELVSQVPDHLRRQIKGEVEREVRGSFQKHYADQLTHNSTRIKDQERLLLEKDAMLEKAKNAPVADHTACENGQTNLRSNITKLQQDAKIAKDNYSRLNGEAKLNREQLRHEQTVTQNLRDELETIKADQRRAQNEFAELKGKISLDGDRITDDGRSEEPVRVQDEQQTAISALQDEVTRLSKELEERKARDNAQAKASDSPTVRPGSGSSPRSAQDSGDEAEGRPAPKLVRGTGRRPPPQPAREPTAMPTLGGRAGKKKVYDEYSDGEADDEAGDDRKKVKTEGAMRGIRSSGDKSASAQGEKS